MPKQYEDYTTGADGDEHHPAFGVVSLHRISANPGAVLFQSDVRHPEYMRIAVHEATRKRDGHRDWVHPGRMVCEISLSTAQFASFVVSTGQGSGVPCTIEWTSTGALARQGDRPGLIPAPRLAMTHDEVRAAADKAFERIKEAEAELQAAMAAKPPVPAAERKRLLAVLHFAIENAAPNVAHAAKTLDEHAEAVVEKSRADIETMVFGAAERAGVGPDAAIRAITGGRDDG
jgi:hypothetical protein